MFFFPILFSNSFFSDFKHCKKSELQKEERCYPIVRVPGVGHLGVQFPERTKMAHSGSAIRSSEDEDCQTYKEKENAKTAGDYLFHRLTERFVELMKKGPYAIMIVHNVKFVFYKIRFSPGFNLIENDRKTFRLFKDKTRLKKPKQELDNEHVPRLISPFDCYLQCTKQQNCSSFAFCKHKPSWSAKMTTKCQLSDQVLFGEHYEEEANNLRQKRSEATFKSLYTAWNSVRKFLNGQEEPEDTEKSGLVEDKNCETFTVNYLKHFKSPEDSILATTESVKSEQVDSQEECAKRCYSFNQDEANKQKCGKLEVCHDSKRKDKPFQCNLKPFAAENESQLSNKDCEYYKINSLIDYHQAELDEERDHLEIHSYEKFDSCAKDCTGLGDACKEFNFCWMKTPEEHSYEDEHGFCLWRVKEKSESRHFNVSEKALNCVTMIKNDHIIASELERTLSDQFYPHLYRNKLVKEQNPSELTASALKLFLFAFGATGMLLGWLGFSYYEKKISPAYKAEAGTFFPTRRIVKVMRREDGNADGNEVEIRETEVQVQKSENDNEDGEQRSSQNSNGNSIYSYQNPNYLDHAEGGESTEMKRMDEDEFTDIKL